MDPIAVAVLLCVAYVVILYIPIPVLYKPSSLLEYNGGISPSSPTIVRQRFIGVSVVTCVGVWLSTTLSTDQGYLFAEDYAQLCRKIVLVLLLNTVLFLGPILSDWQFLRNTLRDLMPELSWTWWKTFVVAPLTEELCFRYAVLNLLLSSSLGLHGSVVLASVLFGVAHLSRAIDAAIVSYEEISWGACLFQVGFTGVFGLYAGYATAFTESVWPAVLLHTYCNALGVPCGPKNKKEIGYYVLGLVAFFLVFETLCTA